MWTPLEVNRSSPGRRLLCRFHRSLQDQCSSAKATISPTAQVRTKRVTSADRTDRAGFLAAGSGPTALFCAGPQGRGRHNPVHFPAARNPARSVRSADVTRFVQHLGAVGLIVAFRCCMVLADSDETGRGALRPGNYLYFSGVTFFTLATATCTDRRAGQGSGRSSRRAWESDSWR